MKKLQQPITPVMVHTVATLMAVGLPHTAIERRSGATEAAIKRITATPEWADLLASKEAALDRLMSGDA